jgi:hypothetical protein
MILFFNFPLVFVTYTNREISGLSMEREARAHEAARALSQLRDIKEELKMKELVIYDYTKQSHEAETRYAGERRGEKERRRGARGEEERRGAGRTNFLYQVTTV